MATKMVCTGWQIIKIFSPDASMNYIVHMTQCLSQTCSQDSSPKHNIPVERINVTLEVAVDKNNSMQIMARMDGKTRNIFVYAESGTVSSYITL